VTASSLQIVTERVRLQTKGDSDIVDLTPEVQGLVARHGFQDGQALVFVSGATAAITTLEYEPGLLQDIPAALERIAPKGIAYKHEEAWQDGNGHSHVRASMLGPSVTVPFAGGRLLLGTWQQVVLVDFDTRPRRREVVVQLTGQIGRRG
jgi:secondary thiamine-phosphate synthase enzyme